MMMVSIILLSDLTDVFYLLLQSHFFPFFCVTKSISMASIPTNHQQKSNIPFFSFLVREKTTNEVVFLLFNRKQSSESYCLSIVEIIFFSLLVMNDKILNGTQNSSSHMNEHCPLSEIMMKKQKPSE